MDSIAVFLSNYLNLSETFIYQRLINFRDLRPIVLCYGVSNPEVFPFKPVYSLKSNIPGLEGLRRAIFSNFGISGQFDRAIRDNGVRLIQAHFAPRAMEALWLSRKFGIPQVNFFHGTDLDIYSADPKRRPALARLVSETALSVANCRALKQKLVDMGCREDKIIVNYAGIDLTKFSLKKTPTKKPGDSVKILMCGRLIWKKGFEYGIEAFSRVIKEHPYIKLDIVGGGEEKANLEARAERSGLSMHVKFSGALASDPVLQKMYDSDILLAPSVEEGGPINVVKEAMAVGLPVISTFVGGIPEMVEDGINGYLVPPSDTAALENKLRYLLEHREIWPKITLEGRKKAEARFDARKQMSELESTYKRIIYGRQE